MKEEKKITVIIPIYKAEKYLVKCLETIINQTYKNLEIILVDDGSPDNSGNICDEFSRKDERIIVIHNKNKGVSISRNIGIDNSTGEYITFIDADDYVSNNYIEVLYKLISDNKADISIIGNDERYNDNVIKINGKFKKILTAEETIGTILKEKYITSVCWGKMYKKEVIKNNEIRFDSNLKIGEDFKIMMQILEKCNKVAIDTTLNLYHYRLNVDSVTQQEGREEDWIKEIELSKEIMESIKNKYPNLEINAIQRYMRVNITFFTKMIKDNKKGNKESFRKFSQNVRGYRFKYLFFTSASIKYKIKLLALSTCPNILYKLYEIKANKEI